MFLHKSNLIGLPSFIYPFLFVKWYSKSFVIFYGFVLNLNKVKNLENYYVERVALLV